MLKILLGIAVGICITSGQATAADATWYCSAVIDKSSSKPVAFKYVVKGSQLIDQDVWANKLMDDVSSYDPPGVKKGEPITKTFKVLENSSVALVAVNSMTTLDYETKTSRITVETVLIDKKTGNFTLGETSTKPEATYYQGECQAGK